MNHATHRWLEGWHFYLEMDEGDLQSAQALPNSTVAGARSQQCAWAFRIFSS